VAHRLAGTPLFRRAVTASSKAYGTAARSSCPFRKTFEYTRLATNGPSTSFIDLLGTSASNRNGGYYATYQRVAMMLLNPTYSMAVAMLTASSGWFASTAADSQALR
jgi:hypothetical protein